jgi:hypothetical protein
MYKNKFAELFFKPTQKKIISYNANMDIILIVIIIFILIVVAVISYNNTLDKSVEVYNKEQLVSIPKKLKPIEKCNERRNYRLVDYYIASSYNTASIGNKFYDYVSTDAVRNTLLQGARYIQLNVFSLNTNINDVNDEPLIGTSTGNNSHITSLNTIPLKDVLDTIATYAFKVKDINGFKPINYPLIIDLTINTKNINVLDKAARYFKEVLGKWLLQADKYKSFPIQYEYLCNLTEKIILWVNGPGLSSSMLNEIAIPQNLLIQRLHISQLTNSVLKLDELELYLRTISKITIRDIYKQSDVFAQVINTIKTEPNKIYDIAAINDTINIKYDEEGVINKLDLETKFVFFNAIGLSIIEPNPNQMIINNYDFRLPFNTGCQIMAMAYQSNDNNLKLYKEIFEESSFVLKPSNARLPDTDQEESIDLLEQYSIVKQNTNPINYYIPYYNYNYGLIYFQEIASSEYKYAYITDRNGSQTATNIDSTAARLGFKDNTLTNDNYFLLKKTEINGVDAFYILDPRNQAFALTIKDNYANNLQDNLEFALINSKRKQYQTFIIEKPLKPDAQYSIGEQASISIRSVLNTDYPFYLSTYKQQIVLRQVNTVKPELMTFNTEIKTAQFVSKLTNVLGGPIKVYENGFVATGSKASPIEILYDKAVLSKQTGTIVKNNGTTINMKYNDKYLCVSNNKLKLSGKTKCSLILETDNTGRNYFIKNAAGKYLIVGNNGILEFKTDQPIIQAEKRNPTTGKITQRKRVGPKLGSEKYFTISSNIKL